MIRYKVVEASLHHPDAGDYIAFGICAYHDKTGHHVLSVSDVFLNRHDAEALVQRCNLHNLSLIHLPDVIEDAIAR